MPCCTSAASKQAWLEDPVNRQGFPQGIGGVGVAAAEPNSDSAARKCKAARGVSEHVWHEASALCHTTESKHLSLLAAARGRTAHPALPWMLSKPFLLKGELLLLQQAASLD